MTTKTKGTTYWLPTIPYGPVDLINRRAAATGSVHYAMATSHADYNGHHVSVGFKPHAVAGPTWNAEYWWGGRMVLGRGSFARCLEAAKSEYDRGALGTTVVIDLSEDAPESMEDQERLALEASAVPYPGRESTMAHFWTAKHAAVADALHWKAYPSMVQAALDYEGTEED